MQIPFWLWTRVGPRKHVLDCDRIPHAKGQFAWRHSVVSCAKISEAIDLPFGLWTGVGRRKHKFNRIDAMRPCVKLLWPLVDLVIVTCSSAIKFHSRLLCLLSSPKFLSHTNWNIILPSETYCSKVSQNSRSSEIIFYRPYFIFIYKHMINIGHDELNPVWTDSEMLKCKWSKYIMLVSKVQRAMFLSGVLSHP